MNKMTKPSVLGRGLGSLLTAKPAASAPATNTLALDVIQSGASQPRRTIEKESLSDLAASIRAKGVVQPILVRPLTQAPGMAPRYEIVAGERRWRAAQLAGLADIPVHIRELSDQEAVAVALIENIQREQLTPAEEARALQRLIGEFGLTHQEVAQTVGRSRAAVSNLIRLLDLPAPVVELIDAHKLSMGHARALLGIEDDAERLRLAQVIVARGCSVRETENLVRRSNDGPAPASKAAELTVVQEVLRDDAMSVRLHERQSGAGRLVVEFADAATRDALLTAIKTIRGRNS
jgi:ParB family chromosome partitioning protein